MLQDCFRRRDRSKENVSQSVRSPRPSEYEAVALVGAAGRSVTLIGMETEHQARFLPGAPRLPNMKLE